MDKEIQNKTWALLPEEFKEEVISSYIKARFRYKYPAAEYDVIWSTGALQTLEAIFGKSNLTDENFSKVEKIGKDWKDSEGEPFRRHLSKNAKFEK